MNLQEKIGTTMMLLMASAGMSIIWWMVLDTFHLPKCLAIPAGIVTATFVWLAVNLSTGGFE